MLSTQLDVIFTKLETRDEKGLLNHMGQILATQESEKKVVYDQHISL